MSQFLQVYDEALLAEFAWLMVWEFIVTREIQQEVYLNGSQKIGLLARCYFCSWYDTLWKISYSMDREAVQLNS